MGWTPVKCTLGLRINACSSLVALHCVASCFVLRIFLALRLDSDDPPELVDLVDLVDFTDLGWLAELLGHTLSWSWIWFSSLLLIGDSCVNHTLICSSFNLIFMNSILLCILIICVCLVSVYMGHGLAIFTPSSWRHWGSSLFSSFVCMACRLAGYFLRLAVSGVWVWVSGWLGVPSDGCSCHGAWVWLESGGLWPCSYYWRLAVAELGPGVAWQIHPSVRCSSGVNFVAAGCRLRCSGCILARPWVRCSVGGWLVLQDTWWLHPLACCGLIHFGVRP